MWWPNHWECWKTCQTNGFYVWDQCEATLLGNLYPCFGLGMRLFLGFKNTGYLRFISVLVLAEYSENHSKWHYGYLLPQKSLKVTNIRLWTINLILRLLGSQRISQKASLLLWYLNSTRPCGYSRHNGTICIRRKKSYTGIDKEPTHFRCRV